MATLSRRYSLVEYGDPTPLVAKIARDTGLPPANIRGLIDAAGVRAASILNLKDSPLRVVADGVRAEDFAGLMLLAPGLELEVAPKFLGNAEGWREDFFLLATLSHHGRLLDHDSLYAASARGSDLATLIGRSLVEMYWRNHRRPLRAYRRLQVADFALDGDVDAADLRLPDEQGYQQTVTLFTRENAFNAAIRGAASVLAPSVSDPETRARLERVVHSLPPQPPPAHLNNKRIPSRGRHWQDTYDLSLDILRGLGGSYDQGSAIAPGYIVQTWRTWEKLLSFSLGIGFGHSAVQSQQRFRLGRRKRPNGQDLSVDVTPDNMVIGTKGATKFVVDAKYKGNVDRAKKAIDPADVYESLAFAKASGVDKVILAYPRVAGPGSIPVPATGATSEFERVLVDGVTIIAVEISIQGISKQGGIQSLGAGLHGSILQLV